MKTINQLKATDHSVIAKLIKINNGETSAVDYSTTVFETSSGYTRSMDTIGSTVIGSQLKNFVETPLVAERGNDNKTYFSAPDKGIGFGYIFIDYIKKNPLLVLVVDKDGTNYSYASCKFNKETKTWENGNSVETSIENVKGLVDFTINNLSEDVKSFELK
jgi:hypothetical protein